ncbi:MAG: YbjN domain-containing protein [Sphingomonadaceae bacterium]
MKPVLACALAALLLAAPAAAQKTPDNALLSASEPSRIAAYLQELGYRATLGKQADGDPMIETSMAGYNVRILFMSCTDNRACEDIQFFVGIATRAKLSLDQVNRFNRERRFARLYLDDDRDPLMEQDISMIGPGISAAAFRDTVRVFERQVGTLDRLVSEAR